MSTTETKVRKLAALATIRAHVAEGIPAFDAAFEYLQKEGTSMNTHTATPWQLDGLQIRGTDFDHAGAQTLVATVNQAYTQSHEPEANAELIVRAVNSHADMLEALQDLVRAYDTDMGYSAVELRIKLAKDAIAKAKGGAA